MPFVIENPDVPVLASSENFFLSVIINVIGQPNTSLFRRLRTKLYVDGVEKIVKSAQWSQSTDAGNLTIELANIADRAAFTRTAQIKFQAEEFISGMWTVIKTYCDGALLATSNYALESSGNNPNDSFSITILPVLQQRLDTTPTQQISLFDPAKTTVNADEIETVPNIDGTTGTATATPVNNLNLGHIFQFVATEMGFSGFKTNINTQAWLLSRVDFPPAQPLWQTVAGIIGNHEPKLSVDTDNNLVIRDGTLTDFVSARTIGLSGWQSITLNKNIERFKGCILTQQLRANDWDFFKLRQEIETRPFNGIPGAFPQTRLTTWYQDFFRNSFPNAPVLSQVFATSQLEFNSLFNVIAASHELFAYQFGQGGIRMQNVQRKSWSITKAPQAWVNFQFLVGGPQADFAGFFEGAEDIYTSASDQTFTEALVLTQAEKTTFNYRPVRNRNEVVFAVQTSTELKELIIIDADNQMLGEDFEQSLTVSQESGNLTAGQGSRWGITNRRTEIQAIESTNRQVQLRTRRSSTLNSTSGLMVENFHDRRIGDIDESDIQTELKPLYITEGGDATASLWRNVNGGEAPLIILQPLCIRLNRRQDFPGGIAGNLPKYDESIQPGLVIDAQVDGRSATSIGIYEIIGYQDTFASDGFKTSIQARQIAA